MPSPSALSDRLAAVGLTMEEYERVAKRVGRPLADIEIGILGTVWSEHCSYKSSRLHLGRLPTTGPQVAEGPGENAGAVRVGEGWLAVFKMESHNHPSAIAPKEGAATGVGGIIRDILSMGARPAAVLDVLLFPEPGPKRTAWLLEGVVDGVGSYGNCVGVPNVGGQTSFYPGYEGNNLVNAMCVGLVREGELRRATAGEVGHRLVLVGASTGRDGIHGATFASMELTKDAGADLPAVQVGDPFREKLLIEAVLEILDECDVAGLQDLGAGGLTGSAAEMAGKAGLGVRVALDAVPLRAKGMTAYEVALSESQERCLLAVPPGEVEKVVAIAEKWELRAAEVGVVEEGSQLTMTWGGEEVCRLPIAIIEDEAPRYDRPRTPWPPAPPAPAAPVPADSEGFCRRMAANPNLAAKRWVWRQYDTQVQAATVVTPGRDAGVIRLPGSHRGLAMAADAKPLWCLADPFLGAAHTVVEAAANCVARGGKPLAITNCLNFGNPEDPAVMESFALAVDGIAAACLALDTPVVSGNVSFYNESPAGAIMPTPTIGMVASVADARLSRGEPARDGDTLLLLGDRQGWTLAGSEALRLLCPGQPLGLPSLDLQAAKATLDEALAILPQARWITDLSEGGLFTAVLECLPAGAGAAMEIPDGDDWLPYLFSEAPARFMLCWPRETPLPEGPVWVGEVTSDGLFSMPGWAGEITMASLCEASSRAIPAILGE